MMTYNLLIRSYQHGHHEFLNREKKMRRK